MKTLIPDYLEISNEIFIKYFLISYLCLIVVGIFLGAYKKIYIYENYNDLGISLLIFALPATVLFGLTAYGITISLWLLLLLGATDVALMGIIIHYAFKSNHNVVAAIYSIIIKIPLALFFVLLVIELFIPGRARKQRGSNRGYLFLALLVFTPILLSLVKEQKGIFKPQFIINRTRMYY